MTREFAAKAAEEPQAEEDEKYGIPPEVPATVRASVPMVVTGLPATEMIPPVKVSVTLVTDPKPALEPAGVQQLELMLHCNRFPLTGAFAQIG